MHKILVIEDDPRTRANLATEHGQIGLEMARRELPALILCDVMMPELDGHGVLQALRQDRITAAIPFIFLTAKGEKTEVRAGMNLGADDYLTKPATASDLLCAVAARLARERHRPPAEFKPDFRSAKPLESLGLTEREAEVLLWVAQGKSNGEISAILGAAENTVKRHLQNIFEKLGVDSRNAAAIRALETLSRTGSRS
jgi:DNA-binding NarL/FixJ family response regulator